MSSALTHQVISQPMTESGASPHPLTEKTIPLIRRRPHGSPGGLVRKTFLLDDAYDEEGIVDGR